VGRRTVANVLRREGIELAPERGGRTPWSVFLKAHWRSIVAADFFTAEVWSLHGLVTYYVFFVIELAKRIVHIVGITTQPNEGWIMQVARNLTDKVSGFLTGKSHLILDRDTKYTAQFRRLIAESRTAVIRLPPRSHGAQSPRRPEPIAPARSHSADAKSTGAAASATGRDAELLLWRGCIELRPSIWTSIRR